MVVATCIARATPARKGAPMATAQRLLESAILESLEQVLVDTIIPEAGDIDRLGRVPRRSLAALGDAGLLGLLSDPRVGGMGAGYRTAAQVIEAIARHCASTALVVTTHYSAAIVIERHGSRELRKAVAAGRHLSTLALNDLGTSNPVWSALSSVTAVGSESWLRGVKQNVVGANLVDSYIWTARSSQDEGTTLWLVPRQDDNIEIMATEYDTGLRGHGGGTIAADGVRLDHRSRLGDDGKGFTLLADLVLPALDLFLAAIQVGLMESVTRRSASHLSGAFGVYQGKTDDGHDPRASLGKMRARTEMVRSHLHDTAEAMDRRHTTGADRGTFGLKALATEMAQEVTDMGMKIGEETIDRPGTIERCFRDARSNLVLTFSPDALYEYVGRAECGHLLSPTPDASLHGRGWL